MILYRLNKDFIDLDSIPLIKLYHKSILDYLFKEEREVGFEYLSRDVSYDYEVIKSLAEQIISSCCIDNREKFLTSLIAVFGYYPFRVICNASKEDTQVWEDYLKFVEKEVHEFCSGCPEKAKNIDANSLKQYIEELCNMFGEKQELSAGMNMWIRRIE